MPRFAAFSLLEILLVLLLMGLLLTWGRNAWVVLPKEDQMQSLQQQIREAVMQQALAPVKPVAVLTLPEGCRPQQLSIGAGGLVSAGALSCHGISYVVDEAGHLVASP